MTVPKNIVQHSPDSSVPEPTCLSQNKLDDIVRNLNISKEVSELLGSSRTKVTFYREKENELRSYLTFIH